MISICLLCGSTKLVPGPRNQKDKGYCGSDKCRVPALMMLAREDLLTKEEADELNVALGGRA